MTDDKLTPREARELWCRALESGEYAQATGRLRDGFGFCCLGVACELAMQQDIIEEYEASDGTLANYPSVREWLGLADEEGCYESRSTLTDLNDGGKSFAEIAAVIRSEPDGLCVA
jgi:hypothetical protein